MSEHEIGPGYDPARDVVLDARTLRGVAHPLRMRLLKALRADGPQTATQLAAALGESSAATSYHLRTLAAYGFVTEAPELGRGRERFWRAVHRATWFSTPARDAPERELGEAYYRVVAQQYAESLLRWADEAPDWPQEWLKATTMSDQQIALTAEQARSLETEMHSLLVRYRDDSVREKESADDQGPRVGMTIQFQMFPRRGQLDKVRGAHDDQ